MFFQCLLCQCFLFFIVIEDGGHVLTACTGCAVMVVPEDCKKSVIACLLRVKIYIYGLRVVTTVNQELNKLCC